MVTNTLADWVHSWRCPRIWHPLHCSQREISRLGLLLQCCVHDSSAGKGRDEWEPPQKQSRDYSSKQSWYGLDRHCFWSPSSFSEGTQKCQIRTLLGPEPGQILPLTLLRSPQWSPQLWGSNRGSIALPRWDGRSGYSRSRALPSTKAPCWKIVFYCKHLGGLIFVCKSPFQLPCP